MSTPTSTAGRAIGGRYALRSTIGAGGMGTVWRAFDQVLLREVAVKEVLLPPGIPPAERTLLCERTLREARAAASLNVASVVTIYDVVEEDDRPWIVMELLAAYSLAEMIRVDGPLSPAAVADVGLQVIDALDAAHRAGILHRDVKPGNILVASDGRATLTDFGVARTMGDSPLTSTGLLLGSPCYISPERARGREPGPASDLWSLGATLYAAVEGQPPFDLGDPLPTLTAIVTDPPRPCHLAGPLTEVLAGLLEKDPDRRWDATRAIEGLRSARSAARGGSALRAEVDQTSATRVLDPEVPTLPPHPAISPATGPLPAGRTTPGQLPADPTAPTGPAAVEPTPVDGTLSPAAVAVEPLPPPRRRAGRRRWRGAVLVILSLAVAAAAAAAAYHFVPGLIHRESGATKRPLVAPLPTGYRQYTDPAGFSLAVPKDWTQKPDRKIGNGKYIDFKDDPNARLLRLIVSKAGGHDVQTLLEGNDRTTAGSLPGYHKVAITPVQVAGRTGGDWEFTHTSGGDRHVVVRSLVVGDTWYEFYLSTPEDQFAGSKGIVRTVADSFTVR